MADVDIASRLDLDDPNSVWKPVMEELPDYPTEASPNGKSVQTDTARDWHGHGKSGKDEFGSNKQSETDEDSTWFSVPVTQRLNKVMTSQLNFNSLSLLNQN